MELFPTSSSPESRVPGLGAMVVSLSLLLALTAATALAQTAPASNPALDKFNQAITFYASFDGHAAADLSNGKNTPVGNANKLQWEKGILGQSLVARGSGIVYDAGDNIDLSASGSISLWVCPGDWSKDTKIRQVGFFTIHNHGRGLMLARQGGKSNRLAIMAIHYGKSVMNMKTRALVKNSNSKDWQPGQWHLLAVNWNKGTVELSVDGGVFKRIMAHAQPEAPTDDPGKLYLAANGNEPTPYRMDELLILDRPLGNDEVKWMYEAVKK